MCEDYQVLLEGDISAVSDDWALSELQLKEFAQTFGPIQLIDAATSNVPMLPINSLRYSLEKPQIRFLLNAEKTGTINEVIAKWTQQNWPTILFRIETFTYAMSYGQLGGDVWLIKNGDWKAPIVLAKIAAKELLNNIRQYKLLETQKTKAEELLNLITVTQPRLR